MGNVGKTEGVKVESRKEGREKERAEKRRALRDRIYAEAYGFLVEEPSVERAMQALALIYGAQRFYDKGLEELVSWVDRFGPSAASFFALYALAHPRYVKRPPGVPLGKNGLFRLGEEAIRAGASASAVFKVASNPGPLAPFFFSLARQRDVTAWAKAFEIWGTIGLRAMARFRWLETPAPQDEKDPREVSTGTPLSERALRGRMEERMEERREGGETG